MQYLCKSFNIYNNAKYIFTDEDTQACLSEMLSWSPTPSNS